MLIFDASERAMCTVKRQSTSTPLQSLVLLNDPQYIEASRILAEDLIQSSEDPALWVESAFVKLATRKPSNDEVNLLMKIYKSELSRFEQENGDELDLLEIGETNYAENLDRKKLAALSIVINTILNLDECKHS